MKALIVSIESANKQRQQQNHSSIASFPRSNSSSSLNLHSTSKLMNNFYQQEKVCQNKINSTNSFAESNSNSNSPLKNTNCLLPNTPSLSLSLPSSGPSSGNNILNGRLNLVNNNLKSTPNTNSVNTTNNSSVNTNSVNTSLVNTNPVNNSNPSNVNSVNNNLTTELINSTIISPSFKRSLSDLQSHHTLPKVNLTGTHSLNLNINVPLNVMSTKNVNDKNDNSNLNTVSSWKNEINKKQVDVVDGCMNTKYLIHSNSLRRNGFVLFQLKK